MSDFRVLGYLEDALGYHKAGRAPEAEQCYRQALEIEPGNFDALHLLGLLAHQVGRNDIAVEFMGKALEVMANPVAFNNLGQALRALSRFDDAEKCFNQAIQLQQDYVVAYNNLGALLQESGRPEDAEEVYRKALAVKPDFTEAWCNLANALLDMGRFEEAEQACRRALAIQPGFAVAFNILSNTLQQLERLSEAEQASRQALLLQPDFAMAFSNLGSVLHKLGRRDEAEQAYRRAVALQPDLSMAHNNLGTLLRDLSRLEESEASIRCALALQPADAEAFSNLASTLKEAGRLAEAEEACARALAINPDHVNARNNLAVVCMQTGQFAKASEAFQQALSRSPEHAESRFNQSLLTLLHGDLAQGWQGYEWRLIAREDPRRALPVARYDGSGFRGKTVFIYSEQAIGEEIQFSSCLDQVISDAESCILECDARLVPLFSRSFPSITVIPSMTLDDTTLLQRFPGMDCKLSINSLPRYFRNSEQEFTGGGGWLIPSQDAVGKWMQRYQALGRGLKIGISWRGGLKAGARRTRSTALWQWKDIITEESCHFVNLQYGDSTGELQEVRNQWGVCIHSWDDADPLRDLDDFAAQIYALDLVISVDNSTVHMAGALGKPVWCLLPFVPDWRWMLDRDDSPWYPAMRLFRQKKQDDWNGLFTDLTGEFRSMAGCRHDTAEVNRDIAREMCVSGKELLQTGKIRAAEIQFRKALAIATCYEEALFLLGLSRHLEGEYDEALTLYDRLLAVAPCHEAGWNNRGNTLLKLSRHEDAVESYSRALLLQPDLYDARVAQATCYQALGMTDEALSACNEVLEAAPEHAEAHWNRSLLLLLRGEYREGWREYAWRWKKRDFSSPSRHFDQPCWQGEELTGKVILIHAEQGFGDTLQFCRYIPLLMARGARVVLECHAPLVPLLATVAGVSAIMTTGEEAGRFDFHLPMLSLPGIFGTTLTTIPADIPYVTPPSDRLHLWHSLVERGRDIRVGLCWAGKSYPDPGRSCPPDQLALLADLPGVLFHSLQVGRETPLPFAMVDHTDQVRDFADSAALLARLDLVITVDTALAHLAGAMGKPVWVLLPYAPDWRWMLNRDDSPWYPSARLFRQSSRGVWQDVMQRVARELWKICAS